MSGGKTESREDNGGGGGEPEGRELRRPYLSE